MRLMMSLGLLCLLVGCGSAAPTAPAAVDSAQVGRWSLEYSGACSGREAKPIHISQLDDSQMVFDGFHLRRNDDGQYEGNADFIAPMPVDGRDIPYTIAYALSRDETGGFVGTETVVEGGGRSADCPIELVFSPFPK